MKLLHVFAGPCPTVQGTQTLITQTCRLLAQAGHDVHLLCYAHGASETHESFQIHRIPNFPRFSSERSGPSLKKILLDLSLARSCASLLRSLEPDCLHAHHYEALAATRLADPLSGQPLVFHLHALFEPELPTYFPAPARAPAGLLGQAMDRFLPRLADSVVAVSPFIVQRLIENGVPENRIQLLRPPLDSMQTNPSPLTDKSKPIRAAYIGNLDCYQGLNHLLRGLTFLKEDVRKELSVEIVTASESDQFSFEVNRLGLADMVHLVSHEDSTNAWSILETAHIALIPRVLPGGAPIKLVNALAAGKPALVDHKLATELVHGEEVWAIHMRNPAEIAAALTRLVRDESLRYKLGQGALRAAKRLHDPERYLSSLEHLYADVVKKATRIHLK
ncbi:MAG: glycosyltransferase family 4 protein [Deltaproteobacteria bacterium]|nr:glycosyltransferase family 4 protein [Deltaproteobacteria bacterium]